MLGGSYFRNHIYLLEIFGLEKPLSQRLESWIKKKDETLG